MPICFSSSAMVNGTNEEFDNFPGDAILGNSSSRSILLLGANGFLGRELRSELVSPPHMTADLLFYDRKNHDLISYKENSRLKLVQFVETISKSSPNLLVVNCMSARRPSDITRIKEANYALPKSIFQKIQSPNFHKAIWLQPESYWQYALGPTPDDDYVYWKKEFSQFLQGQSQQAFIRTFPLVFCHLIGSEDEGSRFVPKLVKSLRTKKIVEVVNPDESLMLSAVEDVAYFLSTKIKENSLQLNNATQIFPFQKVTIRELTNLILDIIPESPQVTFVKHARNYVPRMSEQIDRLPIVGPVRLTPLRVTLQKISDKLNT